MSVDWDNRTWANAYLWVPFKKHYFGCAQNPNTPPAVTIDTSEYGKTNLTFSFEKINPFNVTIENNIIGKYGPVTRFTGAAYATFADDLPSNGTATYEEFHF